MANFGDHRYVKKKKNILQPTIKRSQSVHMDFTIYLDNLGDRESEKLKRPMCTSWLLQIITVEVGSILNIFGFFGVVKVRSQCVHMFFIFCDVFPWHINI